jgi:hypothetical protein
MPFSLVKIYTSDKRAAFILTVQTEAGRPSEKPVTLLQDYTVSHTGATSTLCPVSACLPGPAGLDKSHPLAVPTCVYSKTKFLSSKFARTTHAVYSRLPSAPVATAPGPKAGDSTLLVSSRLV